MIYDVEIADDAVITRGEQNEMPIDEKLSLNRNLPQEDELDFHKIQQTAKNAIKMTEVGDKPITQAELRSIPTYINDICRYVKKYASNGKMKFEYDCSKLSKACFSELATQFKQKYPLFFLVMNFKTKMLTVDWSGKNEV